MEYLQIHFQVAGIETVALIQTFAAFFISFFTSMAGVIFYSTIPLHQGNTAPPDWFLDILFGLGGTLGIYCGAKWQRYLPERGIKSILAAIV